MIKTAASARVFRDAFVSALAKTVTGGGRSTAYPRTRTAADAFHDDWTKLGGDLRKAVERIHPHGG